MTTVEINVQGRVITVEAAVLDKLPHTVLLGKDVSQMANCLKTEVSVENSGGNVVLGVSPTGLSEESNPSDGEDVLLSEYSFEDDVFVGGEKDKGAKESRSERRKIRHKHTKAKRAGDDDLNLTLAN